MSTPVDARTRLGVRRSGWAQGNGWWLLPEVIAFVVLAVVLVPSLGAGSGGLRAQVAKRAAELVEQAGPTQAHLHEDEPVVAQQTFCGIDVFGTDPPTATALADVKTVYGYYFCAAGSPGLPYVESNRADGPVVVTIAGATRVQIAQSGANYAEQVRLMMPDQYEDKCFRGLPDPSIAGAVRDRYEAALG
jgi:hypothetical protein